MEFRVILENDPALIPPLVAQLHEAAMRLGLFDVTAADRVDIAVHEALIKSLGGFPALSAMPGQFLLKDLVLLGVAILTAGEALGAVCTRDATIPQVEQPQALTPGERS